MTTQIRGFAPKTLFTLASLLLSTGLAGVTGCDGVGHTSSEVDQNFRRVADYDSREMVDDIALFWQTDRPLRTSRWLID